MNRDEKLIEFFAPGGMDSEGVVSVFNEAIKDNTVILCSGTKNDRRYPAVLKTAMASAVKLLGCDH